MSGTYGCRRDKKHVFDWTLDLPFNL